MPAILAWSVWAPPGGSATIWSIIANDCKSCAVIFRALAAVSALAASRQVMEAHPSGEITL
jgi:hypothetical protein